MRKRILDFIAIVITLLLIIYIWLVDVTAVARIIFSAIFAVVEIYLVLSIIKSIRRLYYISIGKKISVKPTDLITLEVELVSKVHFSERPVLQESFDILKEYYIDKKEIDETALEKIKMASSYIEKMFYKYN